MVDNLEQYEKIAQKLDGQDVQLTAQEQAIADEILRDETAIAGKLECDVPAETMRRLQRRLSAEVARPSRLKLIIRHTAIAAAASLIVTAAIAFAIKNRPVPQRYYFAQILPDDVFAGKLTDPQDAEFQEIISNIDNLEAQLNKSFFATNEQKSQSNEQSDIWVEIFETSETG